MPHRPTTSCRTPIRSRRSTSATWSQPAPSATARSRVVHRKVIEGQLWENEPHKIPVCVDCHAPHKVRRVFYSAGMANKDCLTCHGKPDLAMERDGKRVSLYVDAGGLRRLDARQDRLRAVPHRGGARRTPGRARRSSKKVDCSVCHAAAGRPVQDRASTGQLAAQGTIPTPRCCLDCHSHARDEEQEASRLSPTFARNVPTLCARCHRVGEKAAVRIHGTDVPDIVGSYADSIHGKGLTESGLVVTATCVNCHTSHGELPPEDPTVDGQSRQPPEHLRQVPPRRRGGLRRRASTPPASRRTASSCRSARTATARTRSAAHDLPGFRTRMMDQCGSCHEERRRRSSRPSTARSRAWAPRAPPSAPTATARTTSCRRHRPARRRCRRANVVATCAKCHAGLAPPLRRLPDPRHAPRPPQAIPWLFWSFRFMTALLVGTLTFALFHTAGLAGPALALARAVARASRPLRASRARRQALPALHRYPAHAAPDDAAVVLHPRAHRHGAQVLLRRLGAGRSPGPSAASQTMACHPPPRRARAAHGLRRAHLGRPQRQRAESGIDLAADAHRSGHRSSSTRATCKRVRRLDQVVLRHRSAADATGATPTGRSSTTSRSSGACWSSARPASCSGSPSS